MCHVATHQTTWSTWTGTGPRTPTQLTSPQGSGRNIFPNFLVDIYLDSGTSETILPRWPTRLITASDLTAASRGTITRCSAWPASASGRWRGSPGARRSSSTTDTRPARLRPGTRWWWIIENKFKWWLYLLSYRTWDFAIWKKTDTRKYIANSFTCQT